MKNTKIVLIAVLTLIGWLMPALTQAQTYQEMDAEANRVWKAYSDANYNPTYEAAAKEFNAGNYERAIAETNRYLAYMPDTAEHLALRARAYAELFNKKIPPASSNFSNEFKSLEPIFRRAQEDFIHAIELNPENKSYEANFGWLLYNAGYATEAVKHFGKALTIDPQYRTAHKGKAYAAYFTGDFRGCIEAVNTYMAHAEFPKQEEAWAHFRLGECYASLGDKPNAKQNFDKALALKPDWAGSWLYRAFLNGSYKCQKEKRLPSDDFERIAHLLGRSLCPQPTGVGSLGYWEMLDENLKFYGIMHSMADKKLSGRYTPGDIKDQIVYYDLVEGSQAASVDYFSKLEAVRRSMYNKPDTGLSLPIKLILEGAPDELKILAWIEQAKIKDKEAYYGYKYRGRIYAELKKNYQAASKEYANAAALGWTDYELFLLKGRTHLQLGEPEAALEAFQKALEFRPGNPIVQAELKQFATNNPQFASRTNQTLTTAGGQAQSSGSEESALINEYNRLISSNLSRLESQQRGVERKVSDYVNANAGARVFMYRGVYNSINSAIDSHEAFITSLEKLRDRASGNSSSVVSQIDGQIRTVKSSVEKLVRIRTGLPIGQ